MLSSEELTTGQAPPNIMFLLGVSNSDASKFCEGAYLAKTCTQRNPHDDIIDQATTATSKQTLRGSTSFGSTPITCMMVKVPLHTDPSTSQHPDVPTSARGPSDIPTLALPVPDIPASRRRREAHSREVQIIRKWQTLMLDDTVHAQYFMPPQLPQPPPQPMTPQPPPQPTPLPCQPMTLLTGAHEHAGGKAGRSCRRPNVPSCREALPKSAEDALQRGSC